MNRSLRNASIAFVTASALTPSAKADYALYSRLEKAVLNGSAYSQKCKVIPGATVVTNSLSFYCVPPGKLIRTENGVRFLYVNPPMVKDRVSVFGVWYEVNCRAMEHRFASQFGIVQTANPDRNDFHSKYQYDSAKGLMKAYWISPSWGQMEPITYESPLIDYGCKQWRAGRRRDTTVND